MKAITNTLPLAVLFAAQINAQGGTYDDNVVTSYYTLCPSSTSSTWWPSSTSTMTTPPNQLTKTGDDGRTTIYRTETTILPHMCPGGDGVCGATYTLTEECPCTAGPKTVWTKGSCPEGFTTTVVECTACANNGGPSTVTVTTPMSSGPYATVTPKYGSPVNNPSDINTGTTPQETGMPADDNKATPGTGSDKYGNTDNSTPSSDGTSPDRYGTPVNDTKPYNPTYQPYVGSAGRLDVSTGGLIMVIGAGLVGALAVLL